MSQSMILGLDMGNNNFKDNLGKLIPSKISTKENILGDSSDYILYEGIKYLIGIGEFEINLDKINKLNNEILMLSVIGSYDADFFKLVIGLPIGYYKIGKEEIKKRILDKRIYEFEFNGEKKKKIIDDVLVFPEGAGAYFSIPTKERPKDAIIIDIGGKTCNIVPFSNGKLDSNFITIGEGILDLYSKIRDYLNRKYILNLSIEEIEYILKHGIEVDGKKKNTEFVNHIIGEYIQKILNEVRLNQQYRLKKIYICGGGAKILGSILEKVLPNSKIMNNYLHANAEGYYKIGVSTWQ